MFGWTTGNGMACFLSTLYTANITHLHLNVSVPEVILFDTGHSAPLERSVDVLLDHVRTAPSSIIPFI